MSVSLCVIARDEEEDIAGCIGSAAGAADEIVVVDTGSKDRTRERAREAGARVVEFEWRDDFAAARNRALEEATGDWILVLDADERLAPGGAAIVRRAVADPRRAGYRIEVVSDVGPGEPQRTRIVRLHRAHASIRYVRRIHESLNESLVEFARARRLEVADLDLTIEHAGYRPAHFASRGKRERNLRLHRLTVAERPGDAYAWYRFGDELRAVDRAAAGEALDRARDLLESMPPERIRAQVYAPEVAAVRAFLFLQEGDVQRARDAIARGLERCGSSPNLQYVKGLVHRARAEHAEALAEFRALRALDGRKLEVPLQPGVTGVLALRGIAEACEALGDVAGEEEALRELVARGCDITALARFLARTGRAADARRELDAWLARTPGDGAAWAESGKLALDAGAPEVAAKRLAVAASAANAPAWVHRELAIARALSGDLEGALRAAASLGEKERAEVLQLSRSSKLGSSSSAGR